MAQYATETHEIVGTSIDDDKDARDRMKSYNNINMVLFTLFRAQKIIAI